MVLTCTVVGQGLCSQFPFTCPNLIAPSSPGDWIGEGETEGTSVFIYFLTCVQLAIPDLNWIINKLDHLALKLLLE